MMKFTLKIFLPLIAFTFLLACSKDSEPDPEPTPTITGLDFTITTNEENPLQIGVTPSATGAESYKIYFDFVGAPTTFQTSDGTIVSHTYADESATYTIKVVASNSNGAVDVELTKQHTVTVVPDTVIIDFESMNPPYFRGSELEGYIEVISSGIGDNSTAVGKILNDGAAYTSAAITNMNYVDITGGDKTISLDFYQETAGTPKIAIKLEGNLTEGGFDIEKSIDAQAVAGWQTIEFDMSTATNSFPNHENTSVTHSQYSKVVVFIGFGQEDQAGTYYIDNVTTGGVFGADQPDTDGDGVIDPIDVCATTAGTAELNGCPAGPSTAATAPTLAEADVLSIFSDAYTSIPIAEIRTGWSVNAVTSNYEISTGENAIKGLIQADDGYAGILFGSAFDMTGHSTIHMDVWSPDLSNFRMKFEDADDAIEYTVPISATNGWVGVDIALSDFTVVKGSSIPDEANLAVFSGATAGQVFIDNIYLHNGAANTGTTAAVQFTVSAPATATTVNFLSSYYNWDAGPVATNNGDGTWTFSISPAPTAADLDGAPNYGGLNYKWIVDGVTEDLLPILNAGCSDWTQGTNFNTDYSSYANRMWLPGSGNQTGTFNACAN